MRRANGNYALHESAPWSNDVSNARVPRLPTAMWQECIAYQATFVLRCTRERLPLYTGETQTA